jgi:hypothetical protein
LVAAISDSFDWSSPVSRCGEEQKPATHLAGIGTFPQ